MKRWFLLIVFLLFNVACSSNVEKAKPLETIDELSENVSMYFGLINQIDNVKIVNNTDYSLVTSVGYTLERKDNENWYLVQPREELVFIALGLIVQPQSTFNMSVFPLQHYDLEMGYYRIRKSFRVDSSDSPFYNQSFELVANFTYDGNETLNTKVEALKYSTYVENHVVFEVLALEGLDNLKLSNESDYYLSSLFLFRLEKYVDNEWYLVSDLQDSGIWESGLIQAHTSRYATLNLNVLGLESGTYRLRNRFGVIDRVSQTLLDAFDVVSQFNIE